MFFIRCLHTVGIDPNAELIQVIYKDTDWTILGTDQVFLVKNWQPSAPPSNQHPTHVDYAYLNVASLPFIVGDAYQWVIDEISDATGVPGQGPEPDPASLFLIHYIVEVEEYFFDPSYGKSYAHFLQFETASIEYYGLFWTQWNAPYRLNEADRGVDFDGNGIIEDIEVDVPALVLNQNPGGNQLSRELTDVPR